MTCRSDDVLISNVHIVIKVAGLVVMLSCPKTPSDDNEYARKVYWL